MANTKISNLTASAANLASTDLAPIVQTAGVGPVKMTGLQLAGGLLGSAAFNGATVTTSQPVINLSQTWNAAGVTFTGLKFNATDTASASGSLLLDLQTGAASVFNVTKTGGFTFTDASTTTGSTSWNFYASNLSAPGSATLTIGKNTNARANVLWDSLATTATLSAYNSGTTAHVTLLAGGTGGLVYLRPGSSGATQLGAADAAAPVAQTLQVQSVVAGTTNTAGANWTLKGSAGTGTGAGGSIIFQVAPAGTTGTAQNAYATALTIGSDKGATFAGNIVLPDGTTIINTAPSSSNQVGIWAGGLIGLNRGGGNESRFYAYADGKQGAVLSGGNSSGGAPSLAFASPTVGTLDTILTRDAANTLALRNGTSAQKLRVYNTYTSGTNYENYEIDWITTANTALVGPTKGSGGGTQRVQRLQYLEDGGTGSTTPALGTTCPAASATIKSWIKVVTSDGTTGYIPCWA